MLRLWVSLVACGLFGVGCSDEDVARTPGPTDSATAVDSGGSAMDTAVADAPADAAFNVVNGCAQADYVDATADETLRKLDPWAVPSGKKCFKIKKGQSFTWTPTDGFSVHPLEPEGGDMPTPITLIAMGTTQSIAFPNEGTFGYHCANHPLVMLGAIWVVP